MCSYLLEANPFTPSDVKNNAAENIGEYCILN